VLRQHLPPHTFLQRNLETLLHIPDGLMSCFLPLQDAGAPRASVGGPLDGQKVKLYPSSVQSPTVLTFCASFCVCVSVSTAVW
jgi:hypothetical protein